MKQIMEEKENLIDESKMTFYLEENSKYQKHQQVQLINIIIMIYLFFKVFLSSYILQKNEVINYDYPLDIWLYLLLTNDCIWIIYHLGILFRQYSLQGDIFINDSFLQSVFNKKFKNDKVNPYMDQQIIDELNNLDSFNVLWEFNYQIELQNPVLLLTRHSNQFFYLVTYIYGCYMYLFMQKEYKLLDQDLEELFLIYLMFMSIYIFMPILVFTLSILLVPLIFCLQLYLEEESNQPLYPEKFKQLKQTKQSLKTRTDDCQICQSEMKCNQTIIYLPCNSQYHCISMLHMIVFLCFISYHCMVTLIL